jgi:DNA-binding NarL/FixJ family response regulator
MINILIVEDQTMLRESLETLINEQSDMKVVGIAEDASKVPDLCRELKPDLVLMDVVTRNEANGITWTAQIRKEFPNIKVVIMTGFPEITFIEEARKAGAHSFIRKDAGKDHLFYTLHSTMNGIGIYPGPEDRSPFAEQFTEKEISVIRLVCQGKSRSQIAKELEISESVLKPVITSILDKTGFDSITKFAIYASGRGLIVTDW